MLSQIYKGGKVANPNDFFPKGFWDVAKDAGFLTALGLLYKTLLVDRFKVKSDSAYQAEQLRFEREKAIHLEVATQVKDNLAFFQAENSRLQIDFENRIKEVKEDARRERDSIIAKFEAKESEQSFLYNDLTRQIVVLKENHTEEMHKMELRHKDEISALQIRHNDEKNALMVVIDDLEGKVLKLEKMPQYGGEGKRL